MDSTALNPVQARLVADADDARYRAYAPYSGFHVGCAVQSRSGEIYAACNVENTSYPIGTCAERNAIAKAIANEGAEFVLEALALVAYKDGRRMPCTPCGACRQAIMEFGRHAIVICDSGSGRFDLFMSTELLPHSFTL